MRRPIAKRRGTIAVVVALCLVGLISFVAISLDGGMLLEDQRKAQAAADAAALAGAENLYLNYQTGQGMDTSGSAKTAAQTVASSNGFNNDGTTSVVTVKVPGEKYTGGAKSGTTIPAGYLEVTVQLNQSRFFSRVLGSSTLPVTARAVARGKWSALKDGIIVLDPTSSGSLNAGGGGSVSVVGANVIVNSNSSTAAIANGGGSLSAPEFDITGVPGTSTPGGGTFSGTILNGQYPTPDPLAYLPEPDPSTMTVQSKKKSQYSNRQTVNLSPGVYQGGISVSGQGMLNMAPGVYYMDGGGFSFTGQGGMSASGVMIYNAPQSTSDKITINGSGSITLTPPTSGTYTGISIFQDRASSNTVYVSGNGSSSYSGTFYIAGGTLNITGNGTGDVIGSQYISYDLVTGGNGTFSISWDVNKVARMRQIGLVE